jgi:hypothetical protein
LGVRSSFFGSSFLLQFPFPMCWLLETSVWPG